MHNVKASVGKRLYTADESNFESSKVVTSVLLRRTGSVFSEPIFFTNVPSSPHTSSHMSGHHPATARLAGRKRHARFESSEALAELPAVARTQPWSCMDAAPGCRLQRRSSANILTAWPGRVAQAPRAGRARAPWSCSPCWRPSLARRREPHRSGIS
jgi:hypothetical protein